MTAEVELGPARLRRLLQASGALREGHFLLSSGLHSPRYVQCALLLEDPGRARLVGSALALRLAPYRPGSIVSPALGGVIIGHETAAALGVPFRFAERRGGEMELRRGFELEQGSRVAIVEDVVTTGGSVLEVARLVRERGVEVTVFGAILNRRPPDSDPLPAPFEALLRLELESFEPGRCPLCRGGEAPLRPGSREG